MKPQLRTSLFLPFLQYPELCCIQDCACIHCGKRELHSKGYFYRPMHARQHLCHLLHRRLVCRACKRTFAEIDPRFLRLLPTIVVARFPFITSVRGPGIHVDVIKQFEELSVKEFATAAFAQSIKTLPSTSTTPAIPEVHVPVSSLERRRKRRCAFFPKCQMQTQECGGWVYNKGACQQVRQGIVQPFGTQEEHRKTLLKVRNAEKRARAASKRNQAKLVQKSAT